MHEADVIVIGGGPAGTTCARALVSHGARVVVIDAAQFPRDKVCAGWITPHVVAALALDVDEYGRRHTFQPIHGFRVGRVGAADALSVDYASMVSASIRRCEFDAFLLARSGAVTATGARVTSLRREHGRWLVNDRWRAPMIVGAAGYGCPVSRLLNAPGRHRAATVVAREVEYVMEAEARRRCQVQGPVAEIYFTADLQGYGWCVRKHDVMNVGMGRVGGRLPLHDVDAFHGFVRATRGVEAPETEHWRGHAYMAGAPPALRRTDDGLLLIGDAAGLASARSGEGIGPAVDSALAAAEVIRASAPDFSRARLARYDEAIDRMFGRRGTWPDPGRWLPAGLAMRTASALLRSRTFIRRVVLDRWFLHAGPDG